MVLIFKGYPLFLSQYYVSVNIIAGNVSPTKLTLTKTALESNEQTQIQNISREDILGDLSNN